jgi:polysaccharide export outer membrane protein
VKHLSAKWMMAAFGVFITGCASQRMIDTGAVAIVEAGTLPPPSLADITPASRPHMIGPFDRLAVEVFGLPELSRQVQADASGHIALPLAGTFEASGKTPEELGELVEQSLRANHVRDPRVTVSVVETVSQVMTVDGEVRVPGMYPVTGNMTLMRAIARAQGANEFARTSHVVVFRTVEGRQMAALYDLRAIRLGAYADPQIYPQDIVYVGESQARRIFPTIIQASGFLLSPLITILDNNR